MALGSLYSRAKTKNPILLDMSLSANQEHMLESPPCRAGVRTIKVQLGEHLQGVLIVSFYHLLLLFGKPTLKSPKLGKLERGVGIRKGVLAIGESSSAIASEMSSASKIFLAITCSFLVRIHILRTQLANYCETRLPEIRNPPLAFPPKQGRPNRHLCTQAGTEKERL